MQEDSFKEEKKAQKKFLKQDLKARLQEAQREKIYGIANNEEKTEPDPMSKEDAYQAVIAEKMMKKMSKINETGANTQVEENATIKTEETSTENLVEQNNNKS